MYTLKAMALVLAIIVLSIIIIAITGLFGLVLAWVGWLVLIGVIAHHKGRSVAAWVIPCLIIPAIIPLLILPFLRNLRPPNRACTYCREEINAEALVCKHCHSDLRAETIGLRAVQIELTAMGGVR